MSRSPAKSEADSALVCDLGGGMTAEIRPLNYAESLIADEYMGNSYTNVRATKVYALCSVRKLNGKQVLPLANETEFKALGQQLSLSQGGELVQHFSQMANTPVGEELKNSSSVAAD